ncbi:MAG: alpha/beta fold hydrolase [Lautropia sp.]
MSETKAAEAGESFSCRMSDGAQILVRRCGRIGMPRLVLSHGNGLAIDGYKVFWQLLLDRYEVVLFDFRNHGRNRSPGVAAHHWAGFAADLDRIRDAIDESFGPSRTIGVFHSMAAITSLLHAQDYGWRWQGLLLFDAPLYPPDGHPLQAAGLLHEQRMAAWAATRPARFRSPRELADRFAKSRSLRRWAPESYRLMAEAILRPDSDTGGWMLTCPPELESSVYATNTDQSIWRRLGEVPGPVMLVTSDPDTEGADVNGAINLAAAEAFRLPCAVIPDTTHFLQIERPQACADVLDRFVHGLT